MYYILMAALYPISLIPLRGLYLLSDLAFWVLYHLVKYRRKVVSENLFYAFPGKNERARKEIEKKFYRHFCDQWVETLKLLSISPQELNNRFTGNWEVFQHLAAEEKNTYAMLGHTFNWEWANVACPMNTPQQYSCIYLPLSNPSFDRLMRQIRERTGAWMISMKTLKSGLSRLRSTQYILALAADQNPSTPEQALWLPFMNREAPFFRGPEQMARRSGSAVVFAGIKRLGRGYYRIYLYRYCDDASKKPPGEILRDYAAFVEKQLHEQPENWMWTHKRWKHKKADFTTKS